MASFKRVSIKKFHEFALWIFIAAALSISISAAGVELVCFVDVAAFSGVTAKNEYGGRDRKDFIVETTGNGVAIFDADQDGDQDLLLLNGTTLSGPDIAALRLPHFYRNERAAAAALRAERLSPGMPDAQHALALYFAQSGQRKLAAAWEGRFEQSKDADGAAGARAAMLFGEVGQWSEAIAFGAAAIERGDRPDSRLLLAHAFAPPPTAPTPGRPAPYGSYRRQIST